MRNSGKAQDLAQGECSVGARSVISFLSYFPILLGLPNTEKPDWAFAISTYPSSIIIVIIIMNI